MRPVLRPCRTHAGTIPGGAERSRRLPADADPAARSGRGQKQCFSQCSATRCFKRSTFCCSWFLSSRQKFWRLMSTRPWGTSPEVPARATFQFPTAVRRRPSPPYGSPRRTVGKAGCGSSGSAVRIRDGRSRRLRVPAADWRGVRGRVCRSQAIGKNGPAPSDETSLRSSREARAGHAFFLRDLPSPRRP